MDTQMMNNVGYVCDEQGKLTGIYLAESDCVGWDIYGEVGEEGGEGVYAYNPPLSSPKGSSRRIESGR